MFGKDHAEWRDLRDEIAADVLEHGFKERRGAFTAAYDGDDLDAAVLEIGLRGLIAPDDPRFIRTVEAIERELKLGPTVYRYRAGWARRRRANALHGVLRTGRGHGFDV
jgi:GH15 family glucan-1,4-alpha-glucosidase